MGFESEIRPKEVVINDNNYQAFVQDPVINGEQMSRGLEPRDWDKDGYASGPEREPFPADWLLDWKEIDERIEEMERTKTRLSDIIDRAGLEVLNQNGTNYCWINAPIHCVEITRIIQNQTMVRLSPASCGGPIKGYRNVGGWGTEGLKYIAEVGAVPQDLWPANAIDRRYDTPETREVRQQFKVPEWIELQPRNNQQLFSVLVRRFPVAVGLNWWRHEVTYIDPLTRRRVRINNSWGLNWGERGRGILEGNRVDPDDAVVARVAVPSDYVPS